MIETAANSDGAAAPCAGQAVRERIRLILLAEFRYWNESEPADAQATAVRVGAIGAISNVMAALCGHPAPWHQAAMEQNVAAADPIATTTQTN